MALLAEAVQAHDRSVRLRPQTRAWNNLGVSLEAMNRFDEAERAFQETLRLDAGNAAAWLNLGAARFQRGAVQGSRGGPQARVGAPAG